LRQFSPALYEKSLSFSAMPKTRVKAPEREGGKNPEALEKRVIANSFSYKYNTKKAKFNHPLPQSLNPP